VEAIGRFWRRGDPRIVIGVYVALTLAMYGVVQLPGGAYGDVTWQTVAGYAVVIWLVLRRWRIAWVLGAMLGVLGAVSWFFLAAPPWTFETVALQALMVAETLVWFSPALRRHVFERPGAQPIGAH
jgi:hypothetical protein